MISVYKEKKSSKELRGPQKQNSGTNYGILTFKKERKRRLKMEEQAT